MKTLTLLRHAKSSWSDPRLADHERPLNGRGERNAPEMGRRLLETSIRPSLILSSTAVRAWTTAKLVAHEISYPVEFLQRESELYLASLNSLIDVIGDQDIGFNSLLVVAHNPGLTELANYLVPGLTNNLPTCGVLSVSFDSDLWDLRSITEFEVQYFDYPKKKK